MKQCLFFTMSVLLTSAHGPYNIVSTTQSERKNETSHQKHLNSSQFSYEILNISQYPRKRWRNGTHRKFFGQNDYYSNYGDENNFATNLDYNSHFDTNQKLSGQIGMGFNDYSGIGNFDTGLEKHKNMKLVNSDNFYKGMRQIENPNNYKTKESNSGQNVNQYNPAKGDTEGISTQKKTDNDNNPSTPDYTKIFRQGPESGEGDPDSTTTTDSTSTTAGTTAGSTATTTTTTTTKRTTTTTTTTERTTPGPEEDTVQHPGEWWYINFRDRMNLFEPFQLIESKKFVDLEHQPLCRCPRVYWPVCATNNITYVNVCIMNCIGKTLKRYGTCINYRRQDADINEDVVDVE